MTETQQTPIETHEAEPPKALFAIANPVLKGLLGSPLHGLVDKHLILLRWRGRKSGTEYTIPVGYKQDGNTLTVFTFSRWKVNFEEPHPVELKLRGEWRSGTGVMVDDPREAAAFIKQARTGVSGWRLKVTGNQPLRS